MSRVPISELVFKGTNPVKTASGQSVFVYLRGTETQATIYTSETGEATVVQPLTTDTAGLPTKNGNQVWVEAGEYDLKIGSQSAPLTTGGLPESVVSVGGEEEGQNLKWDGAKWVVANSLPAGELFRWTGQVTGPGGFVDVEVNNESPTAGFAIHLHSGPKMTGITNALIGLGLGDGGATNATGLLLSQKAESSGDMLKLSNKAGTTGKLFHLEHITTGAGSFGAVLESINTTGVATPLLKVHANGTPGTGQILQQWGTSAAKAGFGFTLAKFVADSTQLFAFQGKTLLLNGAELQVRKEDTAETAVTFSRFFASPSSASNDAEFGLRKYSGASGKFYASRQITETQTVKFQLGKAAAEPGSEEWLTAMTLGVVSNAAAFAVFGLTPAKQQTAAAVTTGYTAGTSTAVTIDGKFTGGIGATAYTLGDVVAALKTYGWIKE